MIARGGVVRERRSPRSDRAFALMPASSTFARLPAIIRVAFLGQVMTGRALALAGTAIAMVACHSPSTPSSSASTVQITSPITGENVTPVIPSDGSYAYMFSVQLPSACPLMEVATYPNGITFASTLTVAGNALRFYVPDSSFHNQYPGDQGVDVELTRNKDQVAGTASGSTGISASSSGQGGQGYSPAINFLAPPGVPGDAGTLSGVGNSQGQFNGTFNGLVARDTIGLAWLECDGPGITWTLTPR